MELIHILDELLGVPQFQDEGVNTSARSATVNVIGATVTYNTLTKAIDIEIASGSDAQFLRGVPLLLPSVASPNDGDVIMYSTADGGYVATPPPGSGSISAPANPGDDGKIPVASAGNFVYTASPTLATLSLTGDLLFTQANTTPRIQQSDETAGSTNGDAMLVQAQNATGLTSTGGDLMLASGAGTTAAGTVQVSAGSTLMLTVAAGAITYSTSAATAGNLRVPKDFSIFGRNDAGSGNVQLFDWGAAADELVIGADTVAKTTLRTANAHDIYGNGNLLCTFARTPATLDFQTISAITYKSTGIFAFHDNAAQRNLGIFTSGSFTTEDKTIYIGTASTAPAGADNGGSYLWAAGTNGLELRTHTLNALTALLGGYLALGATPATTTTGVSLSNNTTVQARNAANSANLDVIGINGSNNITVGNSTSSVLDLHANTNIRVFSNTVQAAQLGLASGDFIRMGGGLSAVSGTGFIRTIHNATVLSGKNNAASADRNLVSWGVTATDTLQCGDDAVNATYRGLAITIGNNTGSVTMNANSTGMSFQTAGAARATITGTLLTLTASVNIQFASGHTGPTINQVISAAASVTCSPTTIQAQDGSGTTAVTGGALNLLAGSATGGSGTRNGGKATLAGGTGASADGDVALKIKNADFLTCVAAATPYIRLDGHETATTVGAAGAGAALPITPTAYLRISLGGTRFKIPYYAD